MAKRSPEEKIDQEIEYLDLVEENNNLKVKMEEIRIYLKEQTKPVPPSITRTKTMAHVKAEERKIMADAILKIIDRKEE